MQTKKVSAKEAYTKIYDVSAKAVHHASKGYRGTHSATKFLSETLTDNTFCRITGIKYYMNTLHAVVGALKHVETEKIKEALTHPELSIKQKLKEVASHVSKNFSHEATVAAGVFFGKNALVIAPIALGIATAVGFFAPAAAATAGYVAAGAMTSGAMWFLGTHQGHDIEATAAEKISRAKTYIKNLRGAAKGTIPEYQQMHEVSQAMHEAGIAHQEHLKKTHSHHHKPGHHHGHGHAGHTFKQDIKSLLHVHKYPQELARYTKKVVEGSVALFKGHDTELHTAKEHSVSAGSKSKFLPSSAGQEVQAKMPTPQAKHHHHMKV